jgi:16S rRNA processing protein RimM
MVDNYGAGEIIEVDLEGGGTEMYKMSLGVVPEIDLKNGRIVVNPPFEVLAQKNQDANKTKEN